MFKKFYDKLVNFIKEDYKYILFLVVFYIVFSWPVNYYIVTGGGISDVDSRIMVDNAYKSSGSFNISYVTELKGTVMSYLISYVMPDWKRVNMDDYKYNEEEDSSDIDFRSDLDLLNANDTATRLAYTLADKDYTVTKTKIYVISTFSKYKTNLKIKDQILSMNGNSYDSVSDYSNYLQTLSTDSLVEVEVLRGGKKKSIKCKLYDSDDKKVLGIGLQIVHEYESDPAIKIKFKKTESGPSGGLITTLDIYNKLVKEDLTNSLKIAGTGTIEEDGSVGEIGEVKYKLLGAVKDKADVFLVPNGANYKTCIRLKKERDLNIKIIGVDSIDDAIAKLRDLKKTE